MAEVTGQRIVNFVETTNPSNQDYLATDNASNGNRKISYVTLSDKVLDKLSTKTFSLDGSNKTVLDALAELFQADDTLNARIDNIITPSGQASLSELIDVRTNFLGETFGSAGEAVRVSDRIASNLTLLPYTYVDSEDDIGRSFIVDVERYKGGQIVVIFNSNVNNPFPGQNATIIYGNSEPSLSNLTAITEDDIGGSTFTITHEYNSGIGYEQVVRALWTFTLPSDFSFKYIVITGLRALDTHVSGTIITPLFTAHGRSTAPLSFTDPNSDGNIVIS